MIPYFLVLGISYFKCFSILFGWIDGAGALGVPLLCHVLDAEVHRRRTTWKRGRCSHGFFTRWDTWRAHVVFIHRYVCRLCRYCMLWYVFFNKNSVNPRLITPQGPEGPQHVEYIYIWHMKIYNIYLIWSNMSQWCFQNMFVPFPQLSRSSLLFLCNLRATTLQQLT